LVDALVVADILPRRVMITAKSTLFTNPIGGAFLRATGVVPIQRPTDESGPGEGSETSRNLGTFRAVQSALAGGEAVLVFPEGITHDAPSLAPLKTGAARIALRVTKGGDVSDLALLPIGLTYERKDTPRTRVVVQIGEPIVMAEWRAPDGVSEANALTAEIDSRLRATTLNYATVDDAAHATQLVSIVAAICNAVPPISSVDRRLGVETAIARRIQELRLRLQQADASTQARTDTLVTDIDALRVATAAHAVLVEDVEISIAWKDAIRFLIREGLWLVVVGPIAVWGWLNHWLPFRAARAFGVRTVETAADPAMQTVLAGVVLVLVAYLAQTLIVSLIWGPLFAAAYLISLPIAADISVYWYDRMRRAAQRARAFLLFRRNPVLQRTLIADLRAVRVKILALDPVLGADAVASTVQA
jgi:1-acyl-sn-glycerol-3-phosphate acyltransferase